MVLVCLGKTAFNISMLVLDHFDISEQFVDVFCLEGQVFVITQNFLFGQSRHDYLLLFVLIRRCSFLLQSLVNAGDNWLNFVAKEKLSGLIQSDLNTDSFAKLAQQGSLVVHRLKTSQLFLLSWQLVVKLDACDFFYLLVDLTRSDVEETW